MKIFSDRFCMLRALHLSAGILLLAGCGTIQREFLFYPSHHAGDNGLWQWKKDGKVIGYFRQAPAPQNVWLMLHGNGGQAADRTYALHCFSERDAVYILEYPGFGARDRKPSIASLNAAAAEAYLLLRETFPKTPVCVIAESIGSGPACELASQTPPPDKLVLVVPFDNLASTAADHVPFLPTSLILRGTWDNVRSLSAYRGPVEIFGAEQDNVIPIEHAKKLAGSLPQA
jgi:hypothetical protein